MATAAFAGAPAIVGLGVVALVLVGLAGWVVADKARTANTVALLNAARTRGPCHVPGRNGGRSRERVHLEN